LATQDYRQLPGTVDAAIVATPNWTHVEIATYLLEHGVHVLCEKPVALSAAEAEALYAVARQHNVRLLAGHSRRFTDSALALHRLMDLHAFGPAPTVEITAALGVPMRRWPARQDFRADRALAGGGCLIDSGVHLIDLALWLLGEVPRVEQYEAKIQPDGFEIDAWLALVFPGGARARLACSFSHELAGLLEVQAQGGWAKLPINGTPGLEFSAINSPAGRAAGALQVAPDGVSPYERQLAHFASCVASGAPFLVDESEVVAGLRVIEECYARAAA
jgi:predicted dehydrogenase